SISGGIIDFTPNLTLAHVVASSLQVVVSNLSRNAVIRSSGPQLSSAGSSGISITYGEVVSIALAITGSLSSSTVHDAQTVYALPGTFISNVFCNNTGDAIFSIGPVSHNTIQGNAIFNNTGAGFFFLSVIGTSNGNTI